MHIKVLGIDLAKNVFQLHGTDSKGRKVKIKRLKRAELPEYMAKLPPCLVGMEACTGAHYWARLFQSYGHTVRMMAPQFVKPYIGSNKSDANDARGIAEAVTRPEMKFVAIKTVDQQAILAVHRARELFVKQRTAQANQIRGSLQEFGVIIPKGISNIQKLPEILEENRDKLSVAVVALFSELYTHFKLLDKKVDGFDRQIEKQAKQDPMCSAVMELPGVGPLIASAAVATIGDAKLFKNGREVSAFLGLVPKQRSSGETTRLLGITKRGDRYLRKILIQGARNIVTKCETKTDGLSAWVADKKQRRGYNKAAVALANKNARIIWALMATGEAYRGPATLAA